ncbi:hypothetical protein PSAC2689_30344 [Paraburkholderia sacchari]
MRNTTGSSERLRPGGGFEALDPDERLLARLAAHVDLRLETRATCRTQRRAEYFALQVLVELHAAHAGRFAVRHARNRTRNGRRDTARTATGAACVARRGK